MHKITADLFTFHDPLITFQKCEPTDNPDDAIDFILNQKKLQEAFAGSLFAIGLGKYLERNVQFRLINKQSDHDFQIKIANQISTFQFTEQMQVGRKRDAEYKQLKAGKTVLRPYRPGFTQDQVVNWLVGGIERKVKKYYSDKPNLLIYGNFPIPQLKFDATALEVNKINNLSTFESIWIIVTSDPFKNEHRIGRLYPDNFGWFPYTPT